MTDRPIMFSAPMVQALLAGRKTQTRRLLKLPKWADPDPAKVEVDCAGALEALCVKTGCFARLPVARPRDRLWVREAASWPLVWDTHPKKVHIGNVFYPASADAPRMSPWIRKPDADHGRVKPSIHMPRGLSRLTLDVTRVRVQRLQDMPETDALAEGVEYETADPPFYYVPGIWPHSITAVETREGARASFAKLWNHLHGAEAWEANPWVVALSFIVGRGNIDARAAA